MSTDSKKQKPIVDLEHYRPTGYTPGVGLVRAGLWYVIGHFLFATPWLPVYTVKRWILRRFGARIGEGVVIKPRVRIKHPWRLSVGNHSWIGEGVWIDNLVEVAIGENVCISQDAYLLTGNHDYKSRSFSLVTDPVTIEDGAWIGARAVICPGITVARSAVITVGSVLTRNAQSAGIYTGNPAELVRQRTFKEEG